MASWQEQGHLERKQTTFCLKSGVWVQTQFLLNNSFEVPSGDGNLVHLLDDFARLISSDWPDWREALSQVPISLLDCRAAKLDLLQVVLWTWNSDYSFWNTGRVINIFVKANQFWVNEGQWNGKFEVLCQPGWHWAVSSELELEGRIHL